MRPRCGRILLSSALAMPLAMADAAHAGPAATGTFTATQDVSGSPPWALTGIATFDDVDFDVFGAVVNLGASVGTVTFSGQSDALTGVPESGPFQLNGVSLSGSGFGFDVLGDLICQSSTCTGESFQLAFIGDLAGVVAPGGELPVASDIAYVDDGTAECTATGTTVTCEGVFALNAFQAVSTPAGSPVTVSMSDVFIDSGNEILDFFDVSADVTYASVASAGETRITAASATGNFWSHTDIGIARFDISTTATVTGPITVCLTHSSGALAGCRLDIYHEPEGFATMLADDPLCPLLELCPVADGQISYCKTSDTVCAKVDSLSPFVLTQASTVGVTAKKLVVVDKLTTASKAKLVYVSKDASAGIAKGDGRDLDDIAVRFDVAYKDASAAGAFVLPVGASDGTSGWLVNGPAVAKFVNKAAPIGSTQTRIAVIKPGKLLKLVAKGLGDVPLEILGAGSPPNGVVTAYCVQNGGEEWCHCSEFTECVGKPIGGGTGAKLVCKGGVPDSPCTARPS